MSPVNSVKGFDCRVFLPSERAVKALFLIYLMLSTLMAPAFSGSVSPSSSSGSPSESNYSSIPQAVCGNKLCENGEEKKCLGDCHAKNSGQRTVSAPLNGSVQPVQQVTVSTDTQKNNAAQEDGQVADTVQQSSGATVIVVKEEASTNANTVPPLSTSALQSNTNAAASSSANIQAQVPVHVCGNSICERGENCERDCMPKQALPTQTGFIVTQSTPTSNTPVREESTTQEKQTASNNQSTSTGNTGTGVAKSSVQSTARKCQVGYSCFTNNTNEFSILVNEACQATKITPCQNGCDNGTGQCSSQANPAPTTSNLRNPVVVYSFNGDFKDSSGNNFHGTSNGALIVNEGVDGKAASFNNAFVYNTDFAWKTGGETTVMFWMKMNGSDVKNAMVFGVGSQESPNRFLAAPWSDGMLYWDYGTYTTGRTLTDYKPFFDKWTHIVLVSSGNNGNFKAIYVNGELVAQGSVSDGPDAALLGINVGRGTGNNKWYYYNGFLDEFTVYNSVLTPEQVKQNYERQKARLAESSLQQPSQQPLDSTCGAVTNLGSGAVVVNASESRRLYKIESDAECTFTWEMIPQALADYDLYVSYSSNSCTPTKWGCAPKKGRGQAETCSAKLASGTYYALVTGGGGTYMVKGSTSECAPSCSTECQEGQHRCSENGIQLCGNYDNDTCLEWPASTTGAGNAYCPYGCDAQTNECKMTCNESFFCIDKSTVGKKEKSCSVSRPWWGECNSGEICQNGKCIDDPTIPGCYDKWVCVDNKTIAWQASDCSKRTPKACRQREICEGGLCVPDPNAPTCKEEWLCEGKYSVGHKKEDCSTEHWSTCDPFSICQNGECVPDPNPQSCTAASICLDSKTKAKRWSTCRVTDKTTCEAACVNGECTCNDRFECIGGNLKHNKTDCSYEIVYCEAGCSNNQCQCKQQTYCRDASTLATKNADCSVSTVACESGCNTATSQCNPVCSSAWVCLNSRTKAFRERNCEYSQVTSCSGGCQEGACKELPTCSTGSFCKDNRTAGYRNRDCSWSDLETCASDEVCSSGACTPKEPVNRCQSGWFCKDSKTEGYRNSDCSWSNTETCSADKVCSDGWCVRQQPNRSCQAGWRCSGSDKREYVNNSCEVTEEDYCSNNETCQAGKCVSKNNAGREPPTCTSHHHFACHNNNVYHYDSCGKREELSETCSSSEVCTNGYCKEKASIQPPNQDTGGREGVKRLDLGWYCKDSSTMAYKVGGQWTNELGCLFGCSDGKCKHPLEWDTSKSNNSLQKKSLANTQRQLQSAGAAKFIIDGLIRLAQAIFSKETLQAVSGVVIGFGSFVLANVTGVFTLTEWPEYGYDWISDDAYFKDHYSRHVKTINEAYNLSLSPNGYKDFCKDKLNKGLNRFRQDDGRFVSLDIGTGLTVIGTLDGKIVTCFINGKGTITNNILSGRWKPIALFKGIIII